MAPSLSYEELRKKKLEENKKKLEELNLGHLSVAFREATTSPKPSPVKSLKRKAPQEQGIVVLRRSNRVAKLPEPPKYREEAWNVVKRPRRTYKRRDLSHRVYASDEERMYAQTKAEEVEEKLGCELPTFVKPMLQSHVTGGFWLGLPTQFSNSYLPKHDATVTLVDEMEEEFDTVYLAKKRGLSGGWRGFSIHHQLVDGDALVFQLIKPTTFKVYIIRASGYYDK
ncbi:B3 domain-containing protein Os06g0194400-like [Typha angustifolia]|uniref:B3 domain-containing protein Os06g0194400-like n=1 Tax=Typha angustifolia TaxID=59011 RepID=UPI003C2F0A27